MSELDFTPPPPQSRKRARRMDDRLRGIFRGGFWLFVGLFIGMFICNSRSAEWKTADQVLFGTYVVASAIDAVQTDQGIRSGRFVETNPLFGDRPSTQRIVLTKFVIGAGVYWIADAFPVERRTLLWLVNAVQIGVVAHNASIGMTIDF